MKGVIRGKLIVLSVAKKKLEKAYTSSLKTHLKALEQKETNSPKRQRQQEISKLRAEINHIKIKRTLQRINQTRRVFFCLFVCLFVCLFFRKKNKIDKPLIN
jgi:retron-type reverse transcriptase